MATESDKDLFADALALPAKKRARLAQQLLESLDEKADPAAAEAWLAEIERRARQVDQGEVELEDWSVVRERLQRRWRKR